MKIIEEVTTAYSLAATENIKANIKELQDDLEFKLEKTSLPRPQALGKTSRALDKALFFSREELIFFLFLHDKHILWVLIRSASVRHS